MLTYLPLVLTCMAGLPCRAGVPQTSRLPLAPVIRVENAARPLPSLRDLTIGTPVAEAPKARLRSQAGGPLVRGSRPSKGMLVCAGIVAGLYAGAAIGNAMDDSPDKMLGLVTAPIGGAVGGVLVWKLVK